MINTYRYIPDKLVKTLGKLNFSQSKVLTMKVLIKISFSHTILFPFSKIKVIGHLITWRLNL